MYLGIDFGLKRIGIAISHNGKMASPLCTISNHGTAKNVAAVFDIIKKHAPAPQTTTGGVVRENIIPPVVVVLGIPNGIIAEHSHRFGEILRARLGVTVDYWDENFSSIEAETYIRETMNVRDFKKVKELLDPAAAAMVLNSYLETKGE